MGMIYSSRRGSLSVEACSAYGAGLRLDPSFLLQLAGLNLVTGNDQSMMATKLSFSQFYDISDHNNVAILKVDTNVYIK